MPGRELRHRGGRTLAPPAALTRAAPTRRGSWRKRAADSPLMAGLDGTPWQARSRSQEGMPGPGSGMTRTGSSAASCPSSARAPGPERARAWRARHRQPARRRRAARALLVIQDVLSNQSVRLLDRQRLRHEEALAEIAAELAQGRQVLLALDAFGDHRETEVVREIDGRADDHQIVVVVDHVNHEGLVDLELVQRQPLQVRERRIAGAEIVDRQADAEIVQAIEVALGAVGIEHHGALGQLEGEQAARLDLPFARAGSRWSRAASRRAGCGSRG